MLLSQLNIEILALGTQIEYHNQITCHTHTERFSVCKWSGNLWLHKQCALFHYISFNVSDKYYAHDNTMSIILFIGVKLTLKYLYTIKKNAYFE